MRFPTRVGAGKRLRNGHYAVPVVCALRGDSTRSVYYWDLDLACGCSLRRHRTWSSSTPGYAGCPNGHGREIAEARVKAARADAAVEAAVEAVLATWEARRAKRHGKET